MAHDEEMITIISDGANTLKINIETGEIVDWPGGTPRLPVIADRAAYAAEQEKSWATIKRAYDAVLRKLAEADGVKTVLTPSGRSTLVNGSNSYADGKQFADWVAIHEPDPATIRRLAIEAVQAFNPAKLREILGEEDAAELIRVKNYTFIKHTKTPVTAPAVSKEVRAD